jgi:hypothetical protein
MEYKIELHDKSSFEDVCAYHAGLEKMHPNSHVNFSWHPLGDTQSSIICGMPLNMERDQQLLTFDDYMKKWYSPTKFAAEDSQLVNTVLDNFLNSEFSN